ncbi:MAG: NADH oxidase [Pseudomonadales bacterium]|nr:zinc-binding dehydrogenase [Pseudomonadales bacterium]RZV57749.1 MAG: NADH oxidase [Pseudomonadales bacterium]
MLIKVLAAPMNPSDLALLIGPGDVSTLQETGTADSPEVQMQIPDYAMPYLSGRLDQSLPGGNEGAGIVVAAGDKAQNLMGKMVSVAGGQMFAEYCVAPGYACLEVADDCDARDVCSSFVNPMTVLAMLETMRADGFKALINTGAASNLGRMMIKVCQDDGIPLVNIVRREEHVQELQALGAEYVCNSSDDNFAEQLQEAIAATGAMIAFDCIGGGKLADQLLTAMEAVAARSQKDYSRYGTEVHKQVYIYGGLDRSATPLSRSYGLYWSVGGWLLTAALARFGMEKTIEFKTRVASELQTTFASHYTAEVSLAGALSGDAIRNYAKMASGEKYLVLPHADSK